MAGDPARLVRVSPTLLLAAADRCPRRLHLELDGAPRSGDPFTGARLRDALVSAAASAHREGRPPRPPGPAQDSRLVDEERSVLRHALGWYAALYGDAVTPLVATGADVPGDLPRRRLTLSGWLDLVVETPDGLELRQLRAGRELAGADPHTEADVRLALLRLARAGLVPARVAVVDLLRGRVAAAPVGAEAVTAAAGWLDERVALARARAEPTVTVPGDDCRTCGFFSGCPAHPEGANADRRRGDIRPGVLVVTPTGAEDWLTCRRRYRSRHLLRIPESDPARATGLGLAVHRVLRALHLGGPCGDDARLDGLSAGEPGVDTAELRGAVQRHRRHCPTGGAEAPDGVGTLGHEMTVVRMYRPPGAAPFLAAATLDAVWVHAGHLDVHDYKTGRVPDRVGDDLAARILAWVTAPLAHRHGLPLRVTYEALGPEPADPEPFAPDDDDLAEITAELSDLVAAIRAEAHFTGVSDPSSCHWCGYRSICPERALDLPSDGPAWPEPGGPAGDGR